jgi:hypothetical protein
VSSDLFAAAPIGELIDAASADGKVSLLVGRCLDGDGAA